MKLKKVDLRKGWPQEADNFTPWMKEKGLEILAEALGLKLKFVNMEAPVGGFKTDILARNIIDGTKVVIENQLENSDHDHLGKLLTYAAGLDAKTVIWIAKSVRDEHRAALNKLNEDAGNNCRYYAVEVSLWQIGNSDLGAQFTPIVQPIPLVYWEQFLNYMRDKNSPVEFGKSTRSNSVDSKAVGPFISALGGVSESVKLVYRFISAERIAKHFSTC